MAANLRVAAYTVALFEHLLTNSSGGIPILFEIEGGSSRYPPPIILFLQDGLFVAVANLIEETHLSVIGFFRPDSARITCSHFLWVVPIFKLFLYLASQAILTLKTCALSRKSPVILCLLVLLFLVSSNLTTNSCTSGNEPGVKVASLYYAACLVFDAVTMVIIAAYLWKFSSYSRHSNNIGRLTKMMLEDGIVYFVVLDEHRELDILQSRDTVLQSSAASLGYAVTMIFSSRFILNLSEHIREGLSGDSTSRTPMSGHGGRRALHRIGTTGGGDDPMVVTVTKNVITMTDMGPEDP
ncbi:hypothetical protein B0H16DRAFT_1886991 [Mycena metata]|uniref:Uncharacterized protein n=1 Tax=Mycena metata TaxID=1033252 RepID=A0AAD7IZV3_9AGAR|nr:hypothetical protein B0H16DRAFT_1886991 [Mycena metata]